MSPCDQCDYVGNSKQALDYHLQVKHAGIEYPCNLCDYIGYHKNTLRNHMQKKHGKEGIPQDVEPRPTMSTETTSAMVSLETPSNEQGDMQVIKDEETSEDNPSLTQINVDPVFIKVEPVGDND